MAENDAAAKRPIIVIKRNKGGHGGHHRGAWKVAYADFVTAVMALFIVLWLMSADEETKQQTDRAPGPAPRRRDSGTRSRSPKMTCRTCGRRSKGARDCSEFPQSQGSRRNHYHC